MVKQGDFIAQLDRTEYDNNLKDDRERLTNLQSNLDMKLLDTAVVLNSLRDDIKNQRYLVSEAELKLKNSKYEAPDVIRQAEISLDKARRNLEQKLRYYTLRVAQVNQEIRNTTFYIDRVNSRILSIEDLLRQFTVLAPSEGMVIYKRDFRGSKRKVGTMISPFDRVVATIPDLSSMISRTFISEIEVNKVKPGQKVDITIDALPLKQFKGTVISVANIGEVLPNTDTKVFETVIKLEMSDPALRPSMTSGNKILVREIENAVFVPTESIFSGPDSIPYVYTRNRLKQIVIPGVSNDKLTVIEKGLKAGSFVYLAEPENHDRIRLAGKELIEEIRQRNKAALKLSGR
jgi:multidrug efflux pump subunit AcrA (membrane-fusion protein)